MKPVTTYGQAAYRLNERLQASGYYSVSYADGDDKDGRLQVAKGSRRTGPG